MFCFCSSFSWGINKPREPENYNTYGLSLQFLESINVQPPLVKKVFVANVSMNMIFIVINIKHNKQSVPKLNYLI